MKKRIVALLLCCVMLLTLSPSLIASASAEEADAAQQVEQTNETKDEAQQPDQPKDEAQPTEGDGSGETGDQTGDNDQQPDVPDQSETGDGQKDAAPDQSENGNEGSKPVAGEDGKIPQTVVFTDAGPFLPAVNVAAARSMLRATAKDAKDDGLELNKTAKANDDGTYTITMEAYTTGKVTTITKTTPVDIVLVLDQSGSMAYNFAGESTSDNSARRQYAMKQAVNAFIEAVGKKYSAEADHRIAIVTFGNSASTLQDWTFVNPTGQTELQNRINGLPNSPSGGTQTGDGMTQAESLMGGGYNYTGTNTTRQKVVILFTDGVPGDSGFDTTVADAAIASSKRLKDAGVTVYSVGIFNGANPDEMYGASGFDTNSNGTVNSKWIKDTWGFLPGTDFPEADRPAGNRFLSLLSSNFQNATGIGLKRDTSGLGILHYKITYEITQNFDRTASNYYLTASGATDLNKIFQTISENIQTSNIDLGKDTIIKDAVTPYFDVPQNASEIHLYIAAANKDGTFGDRTTAPSGVEASIKDNVVSVTGFDFNANFVSSNLKADGTYGKKLIIEFTVTPKTGFLGGNNVPTNDWNNSGVYSKDNTEVKKFADETTTPKVNVPVADIKVTAVEKNVYLNHEITEEECLIGTPVTAEKKAAIVANLDLSKADDLNMPYGLDPWQTAYVTITPEVTKPTGAMTADGNYAVTVKVTPNDALNTSKGTPATEKSGSSTAKINVFKPELTFKDSTAYYGETVPTDFTNSNKVGATKWMHDTKEAVPAEMIGTEPTLDISYTPDESKLENGKYTKQDVPVSATVKIGTENVNEHTTFVHDTCTDADCNWITPTAKGTPAFLIHIKTCQLTITKTGGKDGEPYVFTVKKDGQPYTEVTIVGNNNVTIIELPVGTYTIVENEKWSWRYPRPAYSDGVTLSAGSHEGTITCTNARTIDKWLNGFSTVVKNVFDESKSNNA